MFEGLVPAGKRLASNTDIRVVVISGSSIVAARRGPVLPSVDSDATTISSPGCFNRD
jgi:hypothetical protein